MNASPSTSCTLAIPDFLWTYQEVGRPRLPNLEKMLARAARLEARHLSDCLAHLFGLAATDLTVAPFTRLADGGAADRWWWLRADPVHLAPDRDQLVLMPQSVLEVAHAETQALAEAFNKVLGADGWHLEFPTALRGYLRCPGGPLDVVTHDPALFTGGAVLAAMPGGADGSRLRALMSEVEMLFHTHEVNRLREEAGRPPINSLWFWGGGRLPAKTGVSPVRIFSALPLVQGLAAWAGKEIRDPNRNYNWEPGDLFVLERNDPRSLDQDWFGPLLDDLQGGRIPLLRMHLGGLGDFELDIAASQRFWRRGRPLGTP